MNKKTQAIGVGLLAVFMSACSYNTKLQPDCSVNEQERIWLTDQLLSNEMTGFSYGCAEAKTLTVMAVKDPVFRYMALTYYANANPALREIMDWQAMALGSDFMVMKTENEAYEEKHIQKCDYKDETRPYKKGQYGEWTATVGCP